MGKRFTTQQKNRLEKLNPQFNTAIANKDFETAKVVMADIQTVFRLTENRTKIAEYKNQLFELAMDLGEHHLAINGFKNNRIIVNPNTRIHLEATALLAICYLRIGEYDSAKPMMKEVLQNDKIIKTERTRLIFKKDIIQRFNEEVALYSLKSESFREEMNLEDIQNEVINIIQTKNEDEILESIGTHTPQNTKTLILDIDSFAKNLLPYNERKLLPSPEEVIKDREAGKTVFSSLNRIIHKNICEPNTQVYKLCHSESIGTALDPKVLAATIVSALVQENISVKGVITVAIALALRRGYMLYCEKYKPIGVLDIRKG